MSLGITLPSGYTPLEYLESTGTQWIDTGYKHKANTWIDTWAMFTEIFAYNMLCGLWNTLAVSLRDSGYMTIASGGSDEQSLGNVAYPANQLMHIEFGAGSTAYINGKSFARGSGPNTTVNNNFFLFAAGATTDVPYTWTSFGKVRIYKFDIYEGSTLVKRYIPAKNSSGTLGMYEIIESEFKTNSGEGAFVEGPAANYKRLEYILTSGTLWVNTAVAASTLITKTEAFVMRNNTSTGQILFGVYDGTLDYYSYYTEPSLTQERIYYNGQAVVPNTAITTNYVHASIVNNPVDGLKYTINGVSASSSYNNTTGSSNTIMFALFADYNKDYGAIYLYLCKLWRFKIWGPTGLLRDYMPAKRVSDSTIGLLDKVTGIFFVNSGSDTFTAGPEMPNELSAVLVVGENTDTLTENNTTILYNSHDKVGNVDISVTTNDYLFPCEVVYTLAELDNKFNINNIGRAYKYLGPTTEYYTAGHTYIIEEYL